MNEWKIYYCKLSPLKGNVHILHLYEQLFIPPSFYYYEFLRNNPNRNTFHAVFTSYDFKLSPSNNQICIAFFSLHLLAKSQQLKHQSNAWNLLQSKQQRHQNDVNDVCLVNFMLTLNRFRNSSSVSIVDFGLDVEFFFFLDVIWKHFACLI